MYCMSPWRRTTMRDIGNGRNEDCDRYVRRNGAHVKQIIVAQRKRVWLITRRTVDQNNPMIYRKMDTVKAVTDMCYGKVER